MTENDQTFIRETGNANRIYLVEMDADVHTAAHA